MPLYTTPDGRYLVAWETEGQGDGNSVIYDNWRANENNGEPLPIWDRWSYEAGLGDVRPPVVLLPDNPGPAPAPEPPRPEPAVPLSNTLRVIRVTDPGDGELVPRMYSYWPNAFVAGRKVYVFAGHADGRARFFEVDLVSETVMRLGSMIGWTGTTEGWYWDAESWLYLIDGPRLRRENPFTGQSSVVVDISDTHPGCILWQAHSSDDGQTHSATVKRIVSDGPYPAIGTLVVQHGAQLFFPAQGDLDESQVTADGGWLVIKENDDNRIINLRTRETRILRDADGAVGHSDCGDGILVGEDNIHGACVLWDLRAPLVPERRRELFSTWNMGHVSIRGGRCLLSDDTHLSLVSLNGGGVVQLLAHGGDTGSYDNQVKANLDPSGRVATYMTHRDGRFDVYLAVLPA